MNNWKNEIVAGVQRQFSAAAQAAEREERRRKAAINLWQCTVKILGSFCDSANRELGKPIFTADAVSQDNNYVLTITYRGPTERLGGISLDPDLKTVTITAPNQSEALTLVSAEDETLAAVHANRKKFAADELAEEVIRSITQLDAGRKFQMPARRFRSDKDEDLLFREG
jgi:hypothetical protein